MKYAQGSFITVPSREKLRGLHPTAQALYMWLCAYANETGNCYPSRNTLANDCGCSDDTIDKMLALLTEEGLVIKHNRTEAGEKLSNLYTVLIEGGSRQKRVPYPFTAGRVAAVNGINSIQLTQTIEVAEDRENVRTKKPPEYENARTVFSWFPNPQPSWNINKTELKHADLLFKRGEKKVKSALAFVAKHRGEDFFPEVHSPCDLERKWEKLVNYKT